MFRTLVYLSLWVTVATQTIQIQEINSDRGYIMLQQGTTDLPTEFNELILKINKTEIQLAYDLLQREFNENPFLQTTMTRRYLKMAEAEKKLFSIRHKRGLFNALGSGIKFLFGTLDDEDRHEIHERLRTIEESTLTQDDINEILYHINNETQIIRNLQNATNVLQNQIVRKVLSDSFLDNIKSYYEHLKDIQLGLVLSKQGILNPKLINPDKISELRTNQFEYIKTSLWQQEDVLYFIVQIPGTMKTYPILKIVPFPTPINHTELNFDMNRKLTNVDKQMYEVKGSKIKYLDNKCIRNLLNKNETDCEFIINNRKEIRFIEPNFIITKNIDETTIRQTCNNLELKIKNHNLIFFSNCKILINEITFESFNYNENFLYVPYAKDITNKTLIQLPDMNLSEVKLNMHKLKTNNNIVNIILIIIAIVLISLIIFKFYKRTYKNKQVIEDVNVLEERTSNVGSLFS